MEGLLALDLWDMVIEVSRSTTLSNPNIPASRKLHSKTKTPNAKKKAEG